MKFKQGITVGAAVCLLLGSVMNVSAAEQYSDKYVSTLIKNQQESLIIDVEAYKAAYDDLAKSFGDDSYAYVNHYLTVGVYEGRTKGVLFDPLVYAESYSDVKQAYGHDITSIVEHYLKFGIVEKRTQGTAQGYADIAAAERAGVLSTSVNREVNGGTSTEWSANVNNNNAVNYNVPVADVSVNENNTAAVVSVSGSSAVNASDGNTNNYVSSNVYSNNVPEVANQAADSGNSSPAATNNSYHHTTSIYDNDEKTLLRVEYYNDNNQLINYSVVTNFDSNTNSYTETIYDSNCVLERTDVYENGSLSSTETP